ncbi:MAG: hypothetical protein COB20_07455 [SAR86 cluster bacterium]|uniref:DUF2306 domain-containing protein n=1 Tax=SAR86 cluster bacterium TaxID=2030880 RepID=A0A2A4X607_9GAMM|nr:MAG: hypothetical protein COB20_07455 [SAR86 cluster bacterium]
MSVGGVVTGLIRENIGGVLVAVLACYSVTTAWMTLRREEGKIGLFEYGALVFVLVFVAITLAIGLSVASGNMVLKDGTPASVFFFTIVALIFASGDIRLILRKGIYGMQRLARHIWRMCFTFFFGALSFFLGQQQVFPDWIVETPVLYVPEIVIVLFAAFWLRKVLSSKGSWQYAAQYHEQN